MIQLPSDAAGPGDPELLRLLAVSDGVIALAYLGVAVWLLRAIRRRGADLPFPRMFLLLAGFLLASAATHAAEAWSTLRPASWLEGGLQAGAALVAAVVAVFLIPALRRAMGLKSPHELARINQALEESNRRLARREQQLEEAHRIARLGAWDWDLTNDHLLWSPQMFRNYGLEPADEPPDRAWFRERIHSEDLAAADAAFAAALEEDGEGWSVQFRILWPDGSLHHIHSRARTVRDETGAVVRLFGTSQDVTARHEREEETRRGEERFRRMVETAHEGIWTIDAEGITTYVNERMARMLGYEAPSSMIGRPLFDFMDDEARVQAEANIERRRAGIEELHEFRLRAVDGSDVWTFMATSPLLDEEGRYEGALAMVTDLGPLREAERSVRLLARTGEILGTSLELGVTVQQVADLVASEAADGCFVDIIRQDGRIERSATAAPDPDLLERLRALPRLVPDHPEADHPIAGVLTRGESLLLPEVADDWLQRLVDTDERLDELRALGLSSFIAVPVTARGRILGALLCLRTAGEHPFSKADLHTMEEVGRRTGVAFDNARLFEALSESEERYRFLTENSTDMITRHDAEGICTYVSPAARELTGYDPEDLLGRLLGDVLDPAGASERESEAARAELFAALEDGRILTIQDRIRRKDGSQVWVEANIRGIQGEDGTLRGMVVLTRDISQRVRAEKELREREAQLAEAQSIARVGSWEWDIERDLVTWSDELHRIYGIEPGTVNLSYDLFLQQVHPTDRKRVDRMISGAYESGEPFEFDHRILRPDGEEWSIHSRGRIERDADGRVVRMTGTAQDVTERVRAQEALRRSEESYRMLADHSNDMIVRCTPQGEFTYASPATRSVSGHDPEELVGRSLAELIHPDDQEAILESRREILSSAGRSSTVITRLRRKDGGWIWAESTGRGVVDHATGRVESIVIVARDVTDNVKAARTIRLLEKVAVAANEAGSVREAMQAALRLVCGYMKWPAGHVYVPAENAVGELAPTDIWHLEDPEQLRRFREVTDATRFRLGEGLPGRVLGSGQPEWVEDFGAGGGSPRAAALEKTGVRAAFGFPVWAGDRTLAVIEGFSPEPGPPEPSTLEIMDHVGAQLGQVLQRQRAETALRASEMRFRALAETATEAILTADEQSRIEYCNDSVTRVFGWRAEDLVGQSLTVLMPERLREPHRAGVRRYVETRESNIIGRPIELTGLRRDGTEFPVELSLASWEGEDGLHFTGIVRDITERKASEEALGEKMEELARSNAELGLFTYVASHDLREPLRTVGSNVQLVARRLGADLDAEVRRSIDFALSGVRRMQALIDDLLLYSRVGTEGKSFATIDSGTALSEAEANLRLAIEESGAEIERARLPRVRADHSQIVQLFQNLLSNAIKFRRDGDPPRVRISAEREGADWVFSVADNGIGIEPTYVDHVFTIFQRLHPEERYPGTGIGLAVCRKIVERHGGRIWVDPDSSRGATFRFTLPARS